MQGIKLNLILFAQRGHHSLSSKEIYLIVKLSIVIFSLLQLIPQVHISVRLAQAAAQKMSEGHMRG